MNFILFQFILSRFIPPIFKYKKKKKEGDTKIYKRA